MRKMSTPLIPSRSKFIQRVSMYHPFCHLGPNRGTTGPSLRTEQTTRRVQVRWTSRDGSWRRPNDRKTGGTRGSRVGTDWREGKDKWVRPRKVIVGGTEMGEQEDFYRVTMVRDWFRRVEQRLTRQKVNSELSFHLVWVEGQSLTRDKSWTVITEKVKEIVEGKDKDLVDMILKRVGDSRFGIYGRMRVKVVVYGSRYK